MARTKLNNIQENFSGSVQSYTNTGSAGGTFYYINLGGIKLLWGISGNGLAGGTAGPNYVVNFPASFFNTIQSQTFALATVASTSQQSLSSNGATTTSTNVNIWASASTTGESFSLFVIGT